MAETVSVTVGEELRAEASKSENDYIYVVGRIGVSVLRALQDDETEVTVG